MQTRLLPACLLLLSALLACTSGSAPDPGDSFAVIGDAGQSNTNSEAGRNSIQRRGVSRLILPGDNLYNSTYQQVWQPWHDAAMTFDVVAIGNHNGGYATELAFFGAPAEYYSKVVGQTRFIVLNSDNDATGPAQATWLDQTLSAATEKDIFVVFHHPSYSVSTFHTWQERTQFQQAVRPVLWNHKGKITALLVGHDHLASFLHINDVAVILSGALQEARADIPVNYVEDGLTIKTEWYFDTTPHWVKLTVNRRTGASQAEFIRASDDRVTCTVILSQGQRGVPQGNCL